MGMVVTCALRNGLSLVIALFLTAIPVWAGTFDLNSNKGVWSLDGGLAPFYPTSQTPLVSYGFTTGTAPLSRFSNESGNQFLVINSGTTPYAGLKNTEVFSAPIGTGGNGPSGAAFANNWTIVMDVRFPTLSNTWKAVFQDDLNNTGDADIFLNPSNQLVFLGAANATASNALLANTWYRLAFTATYDAGTNQQILRAYVNGVITSQSSTGNTTIAPEGRFSLGNEVGLFSDDSGETTVTHLGALAVWRRSLSAADISAIGTYGSSNLTWANQLASDATPPLPALTGRILYGDFVGSYTPPTGSALIGLAESATASTYPGAVCDVNMNLGTNGGSVAGFPNHRFGGPVQVSVLANGDVVSRTPATVTYSGGGADIGTVGNVSFVREGMFLSTSGGLFASSMTVYFPAGMSVAMDADTKLAFDRATLLNVELNQSLQVRYGLIINKGDFPGFSGASGNIYPCTERIPIRFAASSLTWTPSTGQFTFTQTGDAKYHQTSQISLLSAPPAGTVGNAIPKSNDLHYFIARTASGNVNFGTRAGGISTAQTVNLSLNPANFGASTFEYTAHHPIANVKWAGAGTLGFSGNVITSGSGLPGAGTTAIPYGRSVATANCQGQPGALAASTGVAYFLPTSRIWRFTPDGGLSADGALGSGYNSGTDTPTGTLTPQWSAYKEGANTRYAHTVTGGFTAGRFLSAGNAVVGSEISATAALDRPYALFGTGYGSPTNATLVERPGSTAYLAGAADYPGINLRATAGLTASSYLAGAATGSYPLAANSKYYLRNSGVSGLHVSSSSSPISFTAYGGSLFNLTALNLSYLSGINKNSGVNGNITVPTPNSTSFSLAMKRVLFGPQGQIQNASLSTIQPDITLGYWAFNFSPLAIDFPQPEGCPPPPPSEAFVRISARATLPALTTTPVVGNLGFYNGDLVTEASAIAAGQTKVSRFEPGSLLTVPGPSGKNWQVNCTTGIYLNQQAASESDTPSLNAAGLMNVPFFNDLEVHLRTAPAAGGGSPLLHVRSALTPLGFSAVYDPAHAAKPEGVTDYLTSNDYNPIASRKWQNLVNFTYSVALDPGSRIFKSKLPKSDNVLLFQLSQGVKSMTPDGAEILFDGKLNTNIDSFLPQLNFSTLGLGATIPSLQGNINSALGAITQLDTLLADDIKPLIKPSLQTIAISRVNASFFNTLKTSGDRGATLDTLLANLTTDTATIFNSGSGGALGKARIELEDRIDTAISGLTQTKNLIASASAVTSLANGIAAATGSGNSPTLPDESQLVGLRATFDRAIADLNAVKSVISPTLATALNQSSGGQLLIRAEIDKALKDLRKKWAPADATYASAFFDSQSAGALALDLTDALNDRLAGSAFSGQATTILRKHLSDAQFLSREVLDSTLSLASSLLQGLPTSDPIPSLGEIADKLAAANLKGYAHINGDSLHEMRLDGSARLNVPDEMKFDAHFILRDVDSSTPGGACLAAGGAKAEAIIGASTNLNWVGQDLDIALEGKAAFDSTGKVVGLFGDMKLLGELDFSSVKMSELALGFGMGFNSSEAVPGNQRQFYIYGKAAAKVSAMDVAAGVFIGRTCSLDPIKNADPDIGNVVGKFNVQPPYTGAAVYAYGAMSLMPIIGIPPSCLLDLRVGGGQGFFAFEASPAIIAGFKTTQSVTGELLCLASVTGQQDTVIAGSIILAGNSATERGSPKLGNVVGTSRFTASGKVGYGWLSYTFKKSVGLNVTAPPVKFSLDF